MAKSSIRALRQLSEISADFCRRFDLRTVGQLIAVIRESSNEIEVRDAKSLLQIPVDLWTDVELKTPKDWPATNAQYFAGNLYNSSRASEFLAELHARFQAAQFSLDDVFTLTQHVQENCGQIGFDVDFLLRVPEVTFRDDVKLKTNSRALTSGKAFATHIRKIMEL